MNSLNSDLNSRIAVSDLNTVVDSSPHTPLIVQCDINTLNTPYKSGLTSSSSGTAYITGGSDSNYATMFYVPASAPDMFIRSRANGTWYTWEKIVTNADFGYINGSAFSNLSSVSDFINMVPTNCTLNMINSNSSQRQILYGLGLLPDTNAGFLKVVRNSTNYLTLEYVLLSDGTCKHAAINAGVLTSWN